MKGSKSGIFTVRRLTRILANLRSFQLSRDLSQIRKAMQALRPNQRRRLAIMTLRELKAAAGCDFPHLYQSDADIRYQPWGEGTTVACERLRSDNPEVQMCGIALWIAVAYHETQDSLHPSVQDLHRSVIRLARELKDILKALQKKSGQPQASLQRAG